MTAPKARLMLVALRPPPNVNDLIAQAKATVTAMTGNPHFPSPNPPLALIQTRITELETAENLALSKIKGAAADRNAKRRALLDDLHVLKAGVQQVANTDKPNAEAIIASAAMSVKKAKAVHTKLDLVAKDGAVSGSVKLVAIAASRRASYDWQWSPDQKTWTTLPSTLQSHTVVLGLPAQTIAFFRHRSVTKTGTTDWGQIISHLVK